MFAAQHGRLPDGWRALRDTINQDKAPQAKLRETLTKARASLKSGSTRLLPPQQWMFRKASDSKLPPINNQPLNQPLSVLLDSMKRKKADLTKSLEFARHF